MLSQPPTWEASSDYQAGRESADKVCGLPEGDGAESPGRTRQLGAHRTVYLGKGSFTEKY